MKEDVKVLRGKNMDNSLEKKEKKITFKFIFTKIRTYVSKLFPRIMKI